jgi:hypothetical protein
MLTAMTVISIYVAAQNNSYPCRQSITTLGVETESYHLVCLACHFFGCNINLEVPFLLQAG